LISQESVTFAKSYREAIYIIASQEAVDKRPVPNLKPTKCRRSRIVIKYLNNRDP